MFGVSRPSRGSNLAVGALLLAATCISVATVSGQAAGVDAKPPFSKFKPVPPAERLNPPPSRPCPTESPDCLDISGRLTYEAFMSWVGRDVGGMWAEAFRLAGVQWKQPRQIKLASGQRSSTRCGGGVRVTAGDGPFYCAVDGRGTIYLPLVGIQSLVFPRSSFRDRDFALSYVVAHEWAHHIQRLAGVLTAGWSSKRVELQADCLAGVWAHSVWYRKLLESRRCRRSGCTRTPRG